MAPRIVLFLGYAALGAVAIMRPQPSARPRPGPRIRYAPARSWAGSDKARRPGSGQDSESARSRSGGPLERGRGRHAEAPWQIPWAGWKDILWRVYQNFGDDRVLSVAAGVVFYSLLALFPAITALVSLYGLFADPSSIGGQINALSGVLPSSGMQIVHDEVQRLASKSGTNLSFGFVAGLAIALWSANSGVKAIMDALNVVYEEKEKRSFLVLNLTSLAFTLGGLILALLALGVVAVAPLAISSFGMTQITAALIAYLRWPIMFAVIVLALAVMYRYGPSRKEPRWQWLSVGSIIATLLWLIASWLFSWYLANFANYGATYGSLGAAIGFMTWMWISTIVVLFGAELNSEIEHQTAKDSTVDSKEKPLGKRGANKADTVGKAAN